MRLPGIFTNPFAQAHDAPSRPINRSRQRRHALDPNLPAERESFANYERRAGRMPALRGANPQIGIRAADTALANRAGDAVAALRNPARSPRSPGQMIGRALAESYNATGMNVSRIPMGVSSAFSRLNDTDGPPLPTTGGDYATGARYDADGRPTGQLDTESIDWGSPARRAGMVSWGVDLRRPESEVLADVERVAGAPSGFLNMVSMRESDMRYRQYDQGGPSELTTAQGPHQFTRPTFKTWINGVGEAYGVPVAAMDPEEVQDLRYDIRISGALTAEMARYHASLIANANTDGPSASAAELYLMHHGGEEALGLINAVRRGETNRPAENYYSEAAVRNHMRDYYVNGDPRRPRSTRDFFNWMTGNAPNSPHRRNYDGAGLRGLPTDPIEFGARADGTNDSVRVIRPGVVRFERNSQ